MSSAEKYKHRKRSKYNDNFFIMNYFWLSDLVRRQLYQLIRKLFLVRQKTIGMHKE